MVMIRKQVYLSPALDKKLKAEAKRRGISQAALIRARLGDTSGLKTSPGDDAARRRFIQMLQEFERRAAAYKGPDINWKFNREDAYEERLERQMPR